MPRVARMARFAGTHAGAGMGGQTIGRRELMRLMGLAAAASAYPGFRAWAFGDAPAAAHDAARG